MNAQTVSWWENSADERGRLPRRSPPDAQRRPVYVPAHERDLLAKTIGLPYELLLFEAQQTIRLHGQPVVVSDTVPDPRARWRDLVRGTAVTYMRAHCRFCADDGCPLLDAARYFDAVVGPHLQQEGPQ